jgi:hypothetical protein
LSSFEIFNNIEKRIKIAFGASFSVTAHAVGHWRRPLEGQEHIRNVWHRMSGDPLPYHHFYFQLFGVRFSELGGSLSVKTIWKQLFFLTIFNPKTHFVVYLSVCLSVWCPWTFFGFLGAAAGPSRALGIPGCWNRNRSRDSGINGSDLEWD